MIVELNTFRVVLTHHLKHEVGDQLLDLGPDWIEPNHFARCACGGQPAIALLGEPGAMALGQRRIRRCHEAKFKPGNHGDATVAAGADELAQIILTLQTSKGEILQLPLLTDLTRIIGQSAIPDHHIEPIKAQIRQLIHRGLHPATVAQHRHVVGGEPDAAKLLR